MATTITRRSSRRTVEDEHEPPQLQVQAIQQRFVGSGHSPRAKRPAPVATQTQTQSETTRASHHNIAQQQHGNRGRMKRPLELVDGNHDHTPSKRNRIAVEILSRSIPSPILPPRPIVARPQPPPTLYPSQQPLPLSATVATPQRQHQQHQQHPPHHHPPPAPPPPPSTTTTTTTTSTTTTATEPQPAAPGLVPGAATATADQPAASKTASTQEAPAQATTITPRTKNHRDKVLNGIKHELDRLQPSAVDAGQAGEEGGRRKLRSQEATRFKSELSAYFPDYDEVIGNDVKEQHVLNADTPIVVVDSLPSPVQQQHPPQPVRTLPPRQAAAAAAATSHANPMQPHSHRPPAAAIDHYPVKLYSDALFHDIYCSEQIGLAPLPQPASGPDADKGEPGDPLSDAYYAPAHRRAERLEKSIRNTERGRAQHERDQIVRLLNDLQGHDWLRTMGVNGVTESRKKTFEPARDYFIKGCQGILDKFRHWIQEEKRLKVERERAAAERAAEEDGSGDSEDAQDSSEEGDSEDDDTSDMESGSDEEADDDEEMMDVDVADDDDGSLSDGDPPDTSDVDASIARQLHDESLARAEGAAPGTSKRPRGMPPPVLPELYFPPREFVSFFEKRHQREASLGKHRRAGRSVMAWGHGIPELEDEAFDLPEEYRDEEFMKVRERKKRLDRRGRRR